MTDTHATPEQWANMADAASDGFDDGYGACLFELRARVEALEDAARKHIVETSANILALASRVETLVAAERPASASASSLVERVGAAILEQFENNAGNEGEARAAIREVALWLDENTGGDAAWMLNQEAER